MGASSRGNVSKKMLSFLKNKARVVPLLSYVVRAQLKARAFELKPEPVSALLF